MNGIKILYFLKQLQDCNWSEVGVEEKYSIERRKNLVNNKVEDYGKILSIKSLYFANKEKRIIVNSRWLCLFFRKNESKGGMLFSLLFLKIHLSP